MSQTLNILIHANIEGWFVLSWLVNVSWSVILASYHHDILQMFSTAAHLVRPHGLLRIMGSNIVIFAVLKALHMSPLHCVITGKVFTLITV